MREILAAKGTDVVTVRPDQTVHEAMRLLVAHNIGAVLVTVGTELVGILSERDVLRLGARNPEALTTTRVEGAMTRELVVGVPEDEVDYVMSVMTENRIRHLPILEDGQLAGIVSIGDLVNSLRRGAEVENRYLKQYIRGEVG